MIYSADQRADDLRNASIGHPRGGLASDLVAILRAALPAREHPLDGELLMALGDFSYGKSWSISATVRRIHKRDGATHPGWYTEVDSNSVGPYTRQDDAVEAMLTEIAQNRRICEERQAAKQAPAITETHAELRAQWSKLYLVTEYIDKADTAEYRAAVAARTDASQEMVERGLWRSPIGPSSTDPTWETWYEVALEIYDREIAHIARYSVEA